MQSWVPSYTFERIDGLKNKQMFGGAPIHKQTGDALYEKGVKLYPFYGACVSFLMPHKD